MIRENPLRRYPGKCGWMPLLIPPPFMKKDKEDKQKQVKRRKKRRTIHPKTSKYK